MSLINRSASVPGSPAAAGSAAAAMRRSPALRGLMLAAWAMASSVWGTAGAAEPSAVDYFVAEVMVAPTGGDSSYGRATSTDGRKAYASAQDQFVDQVLRGDAPEGDATGRIMSAAANDPPAWPDVGFLKPLPLR